MGPSSSVAAWTKMQFKVRALRTFLSRIEAIGIPAMPVKGILLAHLLYEDLVERTFGDVDLVARPRDFPRILRVARQAGWPVVWDSKQLGNVNFIVEGVAMDVAATIGPPGTSAVRVGDLLRRAQRKSSPLGFPHHQIEIHDHTLLMAVDTFKDKLISKATARADLVRLAALPDFEPGRLVRLAETAGLKTMVSIVAEWVLEEAASPAWTAIRDSLPDKELRIGYAKRYRALTGHPAQRDGWRLACLTRRISDSPSRRAWALALGVLGSAVFVARHGSLSFSVWEDYWSRRKQTRSDGPT
jgi:hypothetical protein